MNRAVFFIMVIMALSARAEWIKMGPAVERLSVHHRASAGVSDAFGIDIAQGDTIDVHRFEVRLPAQWADDISSTLAAVLIVDGETILPVTLTVSGKRNDFFSLRIIGQPANALVEVGDREIKLERPIALSDSTPLFVRFFTTRKAKTVRATVDYEPKELIEDAPFNSVDKIIDYLNSSSDPNEGLWMFYDRTSTPLRADSNSEYVIATVKNGDRYDIIYIDDRQHIPSSWRPFTIKGRLRESDIPGVFDLEWIDRRQAVVAAPSSAVIDEQFLTVNFPYYKTALRFSRSK